jgi:hypothetical protein
MTGARSDVPRKAGSLLAPSGEACESIAGTATWPPDKGRGVSDRVGLPADGGELGRLGAPVINQVPGQTEKSSKTFCFLVSLPFSRQSSPIFPRRAAWPEAQLREKLVEQSCRDAIWSQRTKL